MKHHDVAIMHGRNDDCISELHKYFKLAGLKVEVWDETPKGSMPVPTIITRKEEAATILVVVTGDDIAQLAPPFTDDPKPYLQPRPNVIHELAIAQFIKPEHTLLLCLGESELPSNITGTYVHKLTTGMNEAQIIEVLQRVAAEIIEKSGAQVSQVELSQIHFDVAPFRSSLNKARAAKDSLDPKKECYIIGDQDSISEYSIIQQFFINKVKKKTTPTLQRKVRVFGFTYAVYWIVLQKVLEDTSVTKWTFDLHYIAPSFVHTHPETFGADWETHAKDRERDMKKWFANTNNTRSLAERNVNVRLRSFKTIPYLHGKVWGDKTIYFHSAQWDQHGQLEYPHSFHEIVPATANSERAKVYRSLFHNWVRHYDQNIAEELFASTTIDWTLFARQIATP